MLLIGFGHRARQGKNTAAEAVLNACPLATDVRMYALADALKQEVRVAVAKLGGPFNLIEQFKEAGLMPEWVHWEEPKPRTVLQWWGQWRRSQDPAYWVKRLDAKLRQHQPEVALITDVRNGPDDGPEGDETTYVHSQGGILVKCIRLGAPDVDVPEHISESSLDNYTGWDYTITAATAEECKRKAVDIFREVSSEVHFPGL